MKQKLFFLYILFIAAFPLNMAAQPGYSSNNFQQLVSFKPANNNYYYLNDADFGYLNEFVSLNFTIEFWVKVLPNVQPGTRIFASNTMGMNFSMGPDNNGNVKPGLWFDIWSYDNSGWPSPFDEGVFYHSLAANIPNDGQWMHVAIVKNINQSGADPSYPLEERVSAGQMGLYINGKLAGISNAPLSMTTLSIDNFFIGHLNGASDYLKIDEFRFWGVPLVRSQIESRMNNEIDNNSGSLILYYNFNSSIPNATSFSNKSRGWGSPTTNASPEDFRLELYSSGGEAPKAVNDIEYATTQSGNWNDPNTWGGVLPPPGEVVTINNDITISSPVEVAGLNLNNGKLTISGSSLTLLSPPMGGSKDAYIKTENEGSLHLKTHYKYGALIPVGGNSYNPLYAERDNYDNEEFIFSSSNNLAASGISSSQPGVGNLWYITPHSGTTLSAPLLVKMYWDEGQELNGFNIAQAQIGNLHEGNWTYITVDSVVSYPAAGMRGVAFKTTQFSPFIPVYNNIIPLPVTFGDIMAIIKNGVLQINWTSITETNNSHFIIEASTDGRRFTKIGTVQSKAEGGNSSSSLSYSFETNAGSVAFASLAGLAVLGLLLPIGKKQRQLMVLAMLFCVVGFIACSKNASDLETSNDQQLYIRIAQVDIDGTTSYSKTVKAVRK